MADEIVKRDTNHKTVGAGIDNDANQNVSMLRTDPVTNYLMVDFTGVGATSANTSEIASRDGNHQPVSMAWDDTNKVLQEVLTDDNGLLLVQLS